jgi:hypothetical protein
VVRYNIGSDSEVAIARLAVHGWIYTVLAVLYGIVIVQDLKLYSIFQIL